MTEPVASTAPVRRTVRVAAALVAGQSLLCGVIGWVTFGPPDGGPQAAAPVEPLIRPSAVIPAVSLPPIARTSDAAEPPPARTSRPARAKVSSTRPPRAVPAAPGGTTATTPPTAPAAPADDPPPSLVISPEPEKTRISTGPALVGPPAPAPGETVQGPVETGERCKPEGASGVTADDKSLRCVRDDDGDLRWQIN